MAKRLVPKQQRRRAHDRLAIIAAAAPIAAQFIMLVAMLVERRWMFAMMVVPGLIGCAASAALMAVRASNTTGGIDESGQINTVDTSYSSADTVSEKDSAQIFTAIDCPSWQTLALPAISVEPLRWRHIVRMWLHKPSLDVALGMGVSDVFRLDLARHGPHAMVAGTTGSGKSVLLQTWCIALACRNPPTRLNFVFLDFKGGAAFDQLARLPHVVGNVCDLDLAHATRALHALEAELQRRERIVAEHRCGDVRYLAEPPPRLIIMVDEFHALRSQLPDYVDRLVRIASLGRSLGMHLVACTQNPAGQISADMKANIAVNICLRVRDSMQSSELLGSTAAAGISPSLPGAAYCADGETMSPFICAQTRDMDALVDAVCSAQHFCGFPSQQRLFSPPLPKIAHLEAADVIALTSDDRKNAVHANDADIRVPFALGDDGVNVNLTRLLLRGNIAIIGQHGRGRTTVLATIAAILRTMPGIRLRHAYRSVRGMTVENVRQLVSITANVTNTAPPPYPRTIWLVDDADELLDPLSSDALCAEFSQALHDPRVTVVFTVTSSRYVRVPEHGTTRIVFPTGDRSVDLMDGIPAEILARFSSTDADIPGRAVLVERGHAMPVQCIVLQSVSESS